MKIKFDKDEFVASNPYLSKEPKYKAVNHEVEIPDKLIKSAVAVIDELEDRGWDELQNIWDDIVEFPLVPFPFFIKYREPENEGADYWTTHWWFTNLADNISQRASIIEILEELGGIEILENPVVNLNTGNFRGEKFLISLDPAVLEYLKAKLVKENVSVHQLTESKQPLVNRPVALNLSLVRDKLSLIGSKTNKELFLLTKIRKSSSSLLLDLTIKACKVKPTIFKTITKDDLQSRTNMSDRDFEEAIKNVKNFKKYLSNNGLQGALKDLFFCNSSSGLGYQFRTTITEEEWNELPEQVRKEVEQYLVNIKTRVSK